MTGTRPHLEPGPDHPITVAPAGRRVVVRAGEQVIADSDPAMEGAVWYYPDPYPAVSGIKGMVAFYPDRVSISSEYPGN